MSHDAPGIPPALRGTGEQEPTGRALPPGSAFSSDDGSQDPELGRRLAAYSRGEAGLGPVVERLAQVRVLIPILATLDQEDFTVDGLRYDKEASAGIVALKAPDGRTALPVFSSVAAMAKWRASARPTPADSVRAALSAVAENWALLVLDPGNEQHALIPRPAVWAIAQQQPWIPAIQDGQVTADVQAAIREAVGGIDHVIEVDVTPGRTSEVAVSLKIDANLTRAGLDFVLNQVNTALGRSELVAQRVDGIELRIGKG